MLADPQPKIERIYILNDKKTKKKKKNKNFSISILYIVLKDCP